MKNGMVCKNTLFSFYMRYSIEIFRKRIAKNGVFFLFYSNLNRIFAAAKI